MTFLLLQSFGLYRPTRTMSKIVTTFDVYLVVQYKGENTEHFKCIVKDHEVAAEILSKSTYIYMCVCVCVHALADVKLS
jgi:hypothetical protein